MVNIRPYAVDNHASRCSDLLHPSVLACDTAIARVTREWVRQVDVEIGRRLTEIVGHTPSAEEVRQSGSCVVTRDYVRTYSWNGIPFLVVNPPFYSCNVETY